jgi:hypothetical protein
MTFDEMQLLMQQVVINPKRDARYRQVDRSWRSSYARQGFNRRTKIW